MFRREVIPTRMLWWFAAEGMIEWFVLVRDELAPRVLGLPYHRCVYELLTDTRALGLAALLLFGATCSAAWPPLLRSAPEGERVGVALYRSGFVLHISSLLLVAVHVV